MVILRPRSYHYDTPAVPYPFPDIPAKWMWSWFSIWLCIII